MLSLATRQIKALRVPSLPRAGCRGDTCGSLCAGSGEEQRAQPKSDPSPAGSALPCPRAAPGQHHLLTAKDGARSLQRGLSAMDQFSGESTLGICET